MAANASNYLSKYWFDFDYVGINLYVFWDAEAMSEAIGEVSNVVAVKVNVMFTK